MSEPRATPDLAAIVERLARIEDAEKIRRLKFQFLEHMDAGHADLASQLVTEDVVYRVNADRGCDGRGECERFLTPGATQYTWARRYVTNELLVVEGDRARARWVFLGIMRRGSEVILMTGRYDDHYRRDGAGWLLERCIFNSDSVTVADLTEGS